MKDQDSGKLRIGDNWNAIRIIALSQSNPLKAVAEFVENSIDAKAKHITLVRGKEHGVPVPPCAPIRPRSGSWADWQTGASNPAIGPDDRRNDLLLPFRSDDPAEIREGRLLDRIQQVAFAERGPA
jgi:hypothetical protein